MNSNFDENLDKYFKNLINIISKIESDKNNVLYLSELEKLLNNESEYAMNVKHPLLSMNISYNKELELRTEEFENNYIRNICNSIMNNKINKRYNIETYKNGNYYKYNFEKSQTKLYKDYGSLSKIGISSLIDKIENIRKTKKIKNIKVASFGSFDDILTNYKFDRYLTENKIKVSISEYRINNENSFINVIDNKIINFRNIDDIIYIIEQYDIVVFLNTSNLYKQYQYEKTDRDKNILSYIKYYYELANKDSNDSLLKYDYYTAIYELSIEYLLEQENSIASAKYKMDKKFIDMINYIVSSTKGNCAEVYIYSEECLKNYSKTISKEYYNSTTLYVYHFNNRKDVIISTDCNIENTEELASTNLYNILSSVYNSEDFENWDYYKVKELRDTIITFYKKDEGNLDIWYSIDCEYLELKEDAENFLNSIFEIVEDSKYFNFVRVYLRNIIYSEILKGSVNISGILIAYYIKDSKQIKFKYDKNYICDRLQLYNLIPYKQKVLIYNMIEKLDNYIIRDFSRVKQSLNIDFRIAYSNEFTEEQFKNNLQNIYNACKKFGDKSSRIYMYSKEINN